MTYIVNVSTVSSPRIIRVLIPGLQGPPGTGGGGGGEGGPKNVRTITFGNVTVSAETDDHIVIKKTVGASTSVALPAVATREVGRGIKIVDGKGDALTNPITINPNGSETVVGLSSYVINFNRGSIELWPLEDGTGWYI